MDISDIRTLYGARTPGVIGRHRYYSVLVPFCMVPAGETGIIDEVDTPFGAAPYERLSLIYEVRSGTVSQPGEICFPGGHMEEGETPQECAVRETCEELGVEQASIEIIGQGDVLYGAGNFTLYSYIGVIDFDAYQAAEPDPEEVSETFLLPVETLLEAEAQHYGETMKPVIEPGFPYGKVGISEDYPWRTPSYDIPVYDIDGRVIWGLTGRITESIAETLREK